MQRGQLFQASGSWYVRYYEAPGRRVSKRLGRVSDYPTKESIEPLARELLKPINKYPPRSLGQFIEQTYMPHVRRHRHPSTLRRYQTMWNSISSHCAKWAFRDVWTVQIEWLLSRVAKEGGLSNTELQRVTTFLGGVFQFAWQQGLYDSNPATEVRLPRETRVYDRAS